MAKVKRANVVLRIKDNQVQRYLDNGYVQINEATGEVMTSPVPTDLATLKSCYVKHKQKIAELEEEIAKLKAEKPVEKPAKKSTKSAKSGEQSE